MFKLITDQSTKRQWIVQEEGISHDAYHGAVDVEELLDDYQDQQALLKELFSMQGYMRKLSRDKVTNLDFEKYMLLNRALMQSNCKFNKKTNKLIEL